LKGSNQSVNAKTFDSHSPLPKKESMAAPKKLGGLMGLLAKAKAKVEKEKNEALPDILV
jgi:hypothetical protein